METPPELGGQKVYQGSTLGIFWKFDDFWAWPSPQSQGKVRPPPEFWGKPRPPSGILGKSQTPFLSIGENLNVSGILGKIRENLDPSPEFWEKSQTPYLNLEENLDRPRNFGENNDIFHGKFEILKIGGNFFISPIFEFLAKYWFRKITLPENSREKFWPPQKNFFRKTLEDVEIIRL